MTPSEITAVKDALGLVSASAVAFVVIGLIIAITLILHVMRHWDDGKDRRK